MSQESFNGLTLVVATEGAAASMTAAVQDALWEVDPRQATWAARPLTDLLLDWLRQRRFSATLFVVFATIAVTLPGIGVFALMASAVEQRVVELGIRQALGGRTGDIVWAVVQRGLRIALAGVAAGWVQADRAPI